MNKNLFFLFIILIFSCKKSEIQHPTNKFDKSFINESVQNGKIQEQKEQKYIENWITTQKQQKFQPNEDGFWISYLVQNNNKEAKPLDFVSYTAQITDIEGTEIYSFEDFGIKNIILTKQHEIRGIEKALQKMGKNEETILLLTSFNGYGLYGDENKIGSNQPLKVHLKLLDVKKVN